LKNKIVSLILSICIILSTFVLASPFASAIDLKTGYIDSFDSTTGENGEEVAFIPQKYPDALYKAIYDSLIESESQIDIDSFSVSSDDISWVYSSVYNSHPELFYLSNQFSYAAYSDGRVAYLVPYYKYSGDELTSMREDYNNRIHVIVEHFSALSDVEAVVAINDYLATHYEYDSYSLENDPQNAIRDAYSMLLNKRAVCQGYSLLFTAIMNELGVETASVVSVSMNHQWNLVKLDGYWYHIDVTWDDPTGVPNGYTYHEYMLHSDAAMSERLGHYNWVRIDNSTEACTDTTYDDWAWSETNTQLTPHNKKWYYTKNTEHGIEIVEISKEGTRICYTQNETWDVWGKPGYAYTQSMTTATWDQNWMLYHTQDKLYCYDTVLDEVFYLTDLDVSDGYVYYIHFDDGVLEYVTSQSPSDFTNANHIGLDADSIQYTSDVDGDGLTKSSDVLEMLFATLGYTDYSEMNYSDVDCDGVTDSADLLLLQQIVLGTATPSVIYNG